MNQELARAQAIRETKELLSNSSSFASLPRKEKEELFKDVYREQFRKLVNGSGSGADDVRALARPTPMRTAGSLIDDRRHENTNIQEVGQRGGEFMREVDFPAFVRDLLKAVFDANLEVTLAQMEQYQTLLQKASQSTAAFVRMVKPEQAFARLAEKKPDMFGFGFEEDEDGNTGKAVLLDKDGNAVDTEDSKIRKDIMDATLELAKEQRKLLRETILMGITRLVVEKGQVKASVVFDMHAREKIEKKDKAKTKGGFVRAETTGSSSGIFGGIFGGGSRATSLREKQTHISIASAKSQHDTDLAAKVTGFVDIQFKSDYFKLDNFLDIEKADIAANAPPRPAPEKQGKG